MGKHPADLKFLPNRWHGESKLQFWPGVPQLSAFLHLSQHLSSQSLLSASHGRGICLWTSSATWPHPWLSSSTGCMSFHHDKLGQILVQFEKNSQALFRYVKEGPSTLFGKNFLFQTTNVRQSMKNVDTNQCCSVSRSRSCGSQPPASGVPQPN